nr:LOW QUALITY PROTEIN: shootin-1-like [Oryza sativa Japonica Group]
MAQSDLSFGMNGWMRAEQRRTGRGGDGEPGERGRGSGGSSGVVVNITTGPMTETEDDMAVGEEEEVVAASAETEEHVQRILLAIDAFTRQVSEMLEAGHALFKNLAADFEDRLCSIHKEERVERWEDEIRELRAHDAANEQARSLRRHRSRLPTSHRSSPSTPHRSRPPTPPLRNRARPPPSPLRLLWPPFWCGDGSFPSGDGARLKRCPLGRPAPSPPAGLPSRQKITVE